MVRGGADAVSLINTISSIVSIDLDTFAPTPTIDGKGSHGGYCGPAVKPIALNMVAEIARDPETRGLPISAIGGVTTWRDAAEFIAMSAGTVQVCTAAMTYGFRIVEEMVTGLARWMDEKGYASIEDFRGLRRDRVVAHSKIRRPDAKAYYGGYETEGYSAPNPAGSPGR